MIVIPFLGDQYANAERVEQKQIGLHLDIQELNKETFVSAINKMLKPKYKQNIIKLRELIYDQPMTSRERAVWWTEYVIRHKGAKHLEYPGRLVPFYQKYWLDFAGLAAFLFLFSFKLCSVALKMLISSRKVKRE
jgi:glucuronosyltransferase